ncbi:MAG TPA: hypothetical protein HPP65_13390, partial [Gammaproteobacteria bacterium]|nr:hypothetical protein [Gammaproteobacteria bacterium]
MTTTEIMVPDIGDFDGVEVIEVLVAVGDTVEKEDSLVSLESDKATMEIPSPLAGVVQELKISVGDKVSQGDLILLMEGEAASDKPQASSSTADSPPLEASVASGLAAPAADIEAEVLV